MATPPHFAIRFHLCSQSNAQGTAPLLDFVPDVSAVLAREGLESPDPVLEELNRLHRNFKTHQQRLFDERMDAERRIPDLDENLRLLGILGKRDKPCNVRFKAADGVWADAILDQASDARDQEVSLWLGANVMMKYKLPEAQNVLESSLSTLKRTAEAKKEELVQIKHQLTLCEVTISRFYNYGVQLRKRANDAAKPASARESR